MKLALFLTAFTAVLAQQSHHQTYVRTGVGRTLSDEDASQYWVSYMQNANSLPTASPPPTTAPPIMPEPTSSPPTMSPPSTSAPSPSLSIVASPGQVINDINTLYSFDLIAKDIPVGIVNVRFEWAPGLGSGGTAPAVVDANRQSVYQIQVSYDRPGSYNITASVFDENENLLATSSLEVRIAGTVLQITPPGLQNAEVAVSYSFNFEADGIPTGIQEVEFAWSFGIGSAGVGSSGPVPVIDGQANASASVAYNAEDSYGLVVDLKSPINNTILATSSVTITVGQIIEREYNLTICDTWIAAKQGHHGVTTDNWNISAIPVGAVFDFEYQAYEEPDKFQVTYPEGNLALDTGWRGDPDREGPLYPGGIVEPGKGQVFGVFTRLTGVDSFQVTVTGPAARTDWDYQVRCHSVST